MAIESFSRNSVIYSVFNILDGPSGFARVGTLLAFRPDWELDRSFSRSVRKPIKYFEPQGFVCSAPRRGLLRQSIRSLLPILLLLGSVCGFAQDSRLAQIKSVYIIPNGDMKETRQLAEKISYQLGWGITYNKSDADALIWYYLGTTTTFLGTGQPAQAESAVMPLPSIFKNVEVWTNSQTPEVLWKKQTIGPVKIAGAPVDELQGLLLRIRMR